MHHGPLCKPHKSRIKLQAHTFATKKALRCR